MGIRIGGPAPGSYAPALRRRDLPGLAGIPTIAAVVPTITLSAASAATSVTSGVARNANRLEAFRYFGAVPSADGSGYYLSNNNQITLTSTNGSPAWSVHFVTDAPMFEIMTQGKGSTYRLLAGQDRTNLQYLTASALTGPPANGSGYRILVDWSATAAPRQLRHYRLEMGSTFTFGGLTVLPSDTVVAPSFSALRVMFLGDSFTEPTIQDNTAGLVTTGHDGYAGILGKMLGTPDYWISGSGGTGYLNPGANGRVVFGDRVQHDIVARNPDVVFVMGGLNDANREPTYTPAMASTAAAAVFSAITSAPSRPALVVGSPFLSNGTPTASLLAFRDAIRAATPAGARFVDVMEMPVAGPITTVTTSASTGSTLNAAVAVPVGSYVRVGAPTDSYVTRVRVQGSSGTGPYALNITPNFTGTIPQGAAVTQVGPSYVTGTGRQGATTGAGSADFMIGPDSTHPTLAGHQLLAWTLWELFAALLPA